MTTKQEDAAHADEVQLKDAVRSSAQQIWQAGLGAFAMAREEGSGIFSRLVKEGNSLQLRTQQLAGQKISDAITKMTETIGRQTAGPLGKVEEAFEERVTRTLRNFGVPTQDDLKTLTKEIEDLRKTVAALSIVKARAKRAAAKAQAAQEKAGKTARASKAALTPATAQVLKKRAKPQLESHA